MSYRHFIEAINDFAIYNSRNYKCLIDKGRQDPIAWNLQ